MISLRPLTKEDLPFLLEIRNDYSTRNNLENDSIFTLEQCEHWFENLDFPWYIILKDKTPVGYFRINENDIGCDIHPNYRRNGYARSAYLEYLKDKKFVSLWVFEDNFAKILYVNLGFKPTGDFKILRNRKYVKMIYEK